MKLFFLGWQPRWFVLSENGVLSYYYSHQDVDQGCKGSMNLGACEIVVNQNDNTRLDIVVSHEKVCLKNLFLVLANYFNYNSLDRIPVPI